MKEKHGYGLFILKSEKEKLENMIELRLDRGEKEDDSHFIPMYKEQIADIDDTIQKICRKG